MTASISRVGGFGPLLSRMNMQEGMEVQIVHDDLSEHQTELVIEIKVMEAMRQAAGIRRAELLRELREDRFPVTGRDGKEGDSRTRKGWADFLRREFDLRSNDANEEIKGFDCWEAALSGTFGDRAPGPQIANRVGATHLRELARANGHGSTIAGEIVSGDLEPSQSNIRKRLAALKAAAKIPGVTHDPVPPPPRPARNANGPLKMAPDHPDDPITYDREKYRHLPQVEDLRKFYAAELSKARAAVVKYQGCINRITDKLGDGIHADRHHPNQMHFFITMWKEEQGFDFDAEWDKIDKVLAEVDNDATLAWQRCHGRFLEPGE